jgi:CubicO group peptidase (beta-lactamase class C family)
MESFSMKRIFLCLALFVSTVFSQATRDLPQDISTELELLSTWIEEQISYYRIPGLAIGIVDDQNLLWAKGFGYANVEKKIPMSAETLCRIASITKTFTATAIMQLRDQGKLRLDDPISKHLPWFKIKNRFPEAQPITIENLLTHSAGLPGEAAFPYWTDHVFPTREQMIAALPKQELLQEPWTGYHYSNLGLALAGEIVAAASGEPYPAYVTSHILQPLQMTSSSVVLPNEHRSRLAVSYDRLRVDGTRLVLDFPDCNGLIPAANITSCVNDLAKYLAMHMRYTDQSSAAVLRGSTLKEMQRIHWLNSDWSSGWGLGIGVRKRGERTMVGHSGWVAGYKSHITFCPLEKIGIIVLMNCADGEPTTFSYRAFDLLAPLIEKHRPVPAAAATADPKAWQKYLGRYQDLTGWEARVMILSGKLVLYEASYPPADDPEEGVIDLIPEAQHLFRMSGRNGNNETVRFIIDANGHVQRMYKGENYYIPKVEAK